MDRAGQNIWSKRAVERLWAATTQAERDRAIVALFELYRLGDRRSGYMLATVSKSWLPAEVTLTREERVGLILEQAQAGDSSAALELAHTYHSDLKVEQLRQVLAMAASEGSQEAEELLEALYGRSDP